MEDKDGFVRKLALKWQFSICDKMQFLLQRPPSSPHASIAVAFKICVYRGWVTVMHIVHKKSADSTLVSWFLPLFFQLL